MSCLLSAVASVGCTLASATPTPAKLVSETPLHCCMQTKRSCTTKVILRLCCRGGGSVPYPLITTHLRGGQGDAVARRTRAASPPRRQSQTPHTTWNERQATHTCIATIGIAASTTKQTQYLQPILVDIIHQHDQCRAQLRGRLRVPNSLDPRIPVQGLHCQHEQDGVRRMRGGASSDALPRHTSRLRRLWCRYST